MVVWWFTGFRAPFIPLTGVNEPASKSCDHDCSQLPFPGFSPASHMFFLNLMKKKHNGIFRFLCIVKKKPFTSMRGLQYAYGQ